MDRCRIDPTLIIKSWLLLCFINLKGKKRISGVHTLLMFWICAILFYYILPYTIFKLYIKFHNFVFLAWKCHGYVFNESTLS